MGLSGGISEFHWAAGDTNKIWKDGDGPEEFINILDTNPA